MKHTLKALWLLGIWLTVPALLGIGVYAQTETLQSAFYGAWQFEKAELFEREHIQDQPVLKKTITDLNELRLLNERVPNLPYFINFHSDIVDLICPNNVFIGTYQIAELKSDNETFLHLVVGNPEEVGTEYNGLPLNAPGFQYQVRRVSSERISLTVEQSYIDNGKPVYALITCYLKKDN